MAAQTNQGGDHSFTGVFSGLDWTAGAGALAAAVLCVLALHFLILVTTRLLGPAAAWKWRWTIVAALVITAGTLGAAAVQGIGRAGGWLLANRIMGWAPPHSEMDMGRKMHTAFVIEASDHEGRFPDKVPEDALHYVERSKLKWNIATGLTMADDPEQPLLWAQHGRKIIVITVYGSSSYASPEEFEDLRWRCENKRLKNRKAASE